MEIDSKVLASFIIANRAFGFDKEKAIEAMKELVSRRENGNTFDYETFIEEEFAKLEKPKANVDYKSTGNLIQGLQAALVNGKV